MSPELAPLPASAAASADTGTGDATIGTGPTALARLERENACLRGDLRTLGRRLNHDLRNPLNCISTANEGLRDLSPTHDALTACFAQSISDSVSEAAALMHRLSVFIKAIADPPTPQVLKLEEIVAGTLARLAPCLLKAGATVVTPPAWPIAVKGIPAWIDLILENLVRNSLQHAGGSPRLELGWDCRAGEHRIWLLDSGPGIPPEKRTRLFHPFDRLHELNAPPGYGLPIILRLIELQGGRCGYESRPGAGSCFFFTLPAI